MNTRQIPAVHNKRKKKESYFFFKISYLFLCLIFTNSSFSQKQEKQPYVQILANFQKPPKGYGEVPFYWWQGDTLTRERLEWQLNQLKDKGISSLQINYSHLDFGGISWGLSRPSKPALFTKDWWDLFRWFAAEAQKRGMSVSLSDYTLGIGQGFSMDEALKENPDLNGFELRKTQKKVSGKGEWKLPKNYLNITAYQLKTDHNPDFSKRKDLLSQTKNGVLNYEFPTDSFLLVCVYPEHIIPSFDPMNPKSGKAYVEHFFGKFEKELGANAKALNFFFSDELNFRLGGNLWNNYFSAEFFKQKGYKLEPYLDAVFFDIGNITPKIRLDYNDVIVNLSEKNFFKPVYQWHQDRGLTFGCDHGGRGREVTEFGDYFRTQRWNQGPGSDQPNLGKDLIKAKVASSIAHLYERPRVWLEGFYGSGWGTTSASVTDAIFANYVSGYNLLSFHGLYYSTMGGWWEWAPPCNHFRMPYWQQIDPLMTCIQRISYLFTQGVHVCDVAILYPVESVVAGTNGNEAVKSAFDAGEKIYSQGIDFDFLDFESLQNSVINDKMLQISGEKYKVIIIPSMKTMRYASLKKLEEFKKAGGIIISIGDLPENSDRQGANDAVLNSLVKSVFTTTSNLILCKSNDSIATIIQKKISYDFKVSGNIEKRPYKMHRKIGDADLFALYNLQVGSKCYFEAKGNAEIWNPWTGEVSSLENFSKATGNGTEIDLPLSEKELQIIVFTPKNQQSKTNNPKLTHLKIKKEILVDSLWEFELKPSLDNRWGDFQLPAQNELMGAQVRQFHYKEVSSYNGDKISANDEWKTVTYGYGNQLLKLGALPEMPTVSDLQKLIPQKAGEQFNLNNKNFSWEDYSFSWKTGVEGDYGHQGYHGLKGEMYDNFIRLGKLTEDKMSLKRTPEKDGNYYLLYSNIIAPEKGDYNLLTGTVKPVSFFINEIKIDCNQPTVSLNKGANSILLCYDKACETYLIFRKKNIPYPKKQVVAMQWFNDSAVLPFDYFAQKQTTGLFYFNSAPALQSFTFSAFGKISVWINGISEKVEDAGKNENGSTKYNVVVKNVSLESSQVIVKVEFQDGYHGAGAFTEFVKQNCGKGKIFIGDWSKIDGLRAYSGGAWYRKNITLNTEDLSKKVEIDLGDLVSSCEVFVNGRSVGIRLSPPWNFDISKYCNAGENMVELLIYNTLANNYTTIPTRYRGDIKSGLLGKVKLRIFE